MQPRRELKVPRGSSDDAHVEVSVEDTGPGLAAEVAAQLFQPFVTTKKQAWGWACRSAGRSSRLMAERSGPSSDRGKGTVFRFTLRAVRKRGDRRCRVMSPCTWSTMTLRCASHWPFCWHRMAFPSACMNRPLPSSTTCRMRAAGCIVTDVRMPGIDGIELIRRLKDRGIALPVIVITGHADVPMAVEAMKEGAVDFLEKPFSDEVFLATVRAALARQEKDSQHGAQVAQIQARFDTLSERERQVLDGLVAGKANKVIAYDLGISPRTVEIYRANVMAKMQAKSLSELVRLALLIQES